MVVFLIQSTSADSAPVYYDPTAGRSSGHGIHGWTTDKDQALGFAEKHDAQRFMDALLPRMGDTCRPVPHTRG